MKLTDEIRAQVYRELADEIQQKGWDTMAILLREHADEKDPPRPEPLEVVVKVPPVSEWPEDAAELALVFWDSCYRDDPDVEPEWRITRAESEATEAKDAFDRYVATAKLEEDMIEKDVLQDRIDRAVEYADLYSLPRLREILTGEAEHGE